MSMTRWDPFRDVLSLREAMNQLLEESFIRPGTSGGAGARGGAQGLALDIAERDNAYEIKASLPGVRPEDVQVTVLGDTLTIRAETKSDEERSGGGYLLRERQTGVVQRTVTLPGPIESDSVEAEYENGVLTLSLPKSRASMPQRIQIRTGASGGNLPKPAVQVQSGTQEQGQGPDQTENSQTSTGSMPE